MLHTDIHGDLLGGMPGCRPLPSGGGFRSSGQSGQRRDGRGGRSVARRAGCFLQSAEGRLGGNVCVRDFRNKSICELLTQRFL